MGMTSFEPAEDVTKKEPRDTRKRKMKTQGICIERAALIVKKRAEEGGKGQTNDPGEALVSGEQERQQGNGHQ